MTRRKWSGSGVSFGSYNRLTAWLACFLFGLTLIVARCAAGNTSFILQPRRWVVERSLGWLGRWRRLFRDYEALPEVFEATITLAMIRLILHRLLYRGRKRLPPHDLCQELSGPNELCIISMPGVKRRCQQRRERAMPRRAWWVIACTVLLCTGLVPGAAVLAQEPAYPSRPVRLLVGYPPGGGMDIAARPLAQRLSERLGQPFVVENRAGANGSVAGEATARAAPDGHTLLLANHNILSINAAVQPGLAFDPARDLVPVAQVAAVPVVLVVPSDLPARSLAGFLALARAQPGRLNMGSNGIGGLAHLALEALNRRAGVSIEHVPFRGGAEITRELLGGRLQLGIDPYATFQGPVEAGRLRVLATAQAERVGALPQVPTVAETPGLEGFEASGFYGLVAPAATPRPVLARLEAAVAWAMGETDLPRAYAASGLVPRYAGAAEFAAMATREREKWTRVAREAGVTAGR